MKILIDLFLTNQQINLFVIPKNLKTNESVYQIIHDAIRKHFPPTQILQITFECARVGKLKGMCLMEY